MSRSKKESRLSVDGSIFFLVLLTAAMLFFTTHDYLDQSFLERCVDSGACEYVEDEDGDVVIRLKKREVQECPNSSLSLVREACRAEPMVGWPTSSTASSTAPRWLSSSREEPKEPTG
jgi:hypothetical protein